MLCKQQKAEFGKIGTMWMQSDLGINPLKSLQVLDEDLDKRLWLAGCFHLSAVIYEEKYRKTKSSFIHLHCLLSC